ncbi:hypothetical protein TrCOL_g9712 [Triparma columacea]|uniref:Uncharacterized protein n=1 Tax=Triparma columacea TaxID=722753 RepID=A0A9W7GCW9_9STRA|nr:hypothetical protein TrCOL_g9712 [Triparma columacea]
MHVVKRYKVDAADHSYHHQRQLRNIIQLHKIDKDTIVITTDPKVDKKTGRKSSHLNVLIMESIHRLSERISGLIKGDTVILAATEQSTMRLKRRKGDNNETEVEFFTELKLGHSVSHRSTKHVLQKHLEQVASSQRELANAVALKDMTHFCGSTFGALLVWSGEKYDRLKHAKKRTRAEKKQFKIDTVRGVCADSSALSELLESYPWFETVLKRARLGEIKLNRAVSKGLEDITEEDARVLGNNLMPCLKSRQIIRAGVDAWRLQNRAIGELFDIYPWIEDMFISLSTGVVKSAHWGLAFRVTSGAVTVLAPSQNFKRSHNFWGDELPFSVEVEKKVTVEDIMALNRDHYEGSELDLTKGFAAGPYGSPIRYDPGFGYPGQTGDEPNENGLTKWDKTNGAFPRAIGIMRTSWHFVAQSRPNLPKEVAGIMWYSQYQPSAGAYAPLYGAMSEVPRMYSRGSLSCSAGI